MKLIVNAAAKINLSLDITGVLENGYHSLIMVMQSVNLCDTVILEKTDSGTIELTCSEPALPCDKRNIAYKAALMFFSGTGIENPGLRIHITKRIPFAAGLAGGSADAAAVICGLNVLFEAGLSETALCAIGIKVGSDVPFCIAGGTRLVENTGDKMTPLPPVPHFYAVLAKPSQGVSTAEAYGAFDRAQNIRHPDNEGILAAVKDGNLAAIAAKADNVFEQVISLPELDTLRRVLEDAGALTVRMSGSGPTLFGIFDSAPMAQLALEKVRACGKAENAALCEPVAWGVQIEP